METRITDLETKISFQEHAIEELNEVVIRQQRQLDQMQQLVTALKAQVKALLPSEVKPLSEEAPPPHY